MIRAFSALVLLASAFPANAEAFSLSLPLDCTPGRDCFIQNHFDGDPGPGVSDYRCGPLSYDGHDGTDIRLIDLAAMRRGHDVLAAAPGVVLGLRDGVEDIAMDDPAAPDIAGQECGNGVLIDNGDGWQTQYCHMRRGSIAVATGAPVVAGQRLGQVGLSGQTMFPHLHLTVRRAGQPVDPFAPDGVADGFGNNDADGCGTPGKTLWQQPPAYIPGAVLSAGIATSLPDFIAVKAGIPAPSVLPPDAPALVVWANLFGVRYGDLLRLSLQGTGGTILSQTLALDRTQAQVFRAIGQRRRGDWPQGPVTARVEMLRDGKAISTAEVTSRIAP